MASSMGTNSALARRPIRRLTSRSAKVRTSRPPPAGYGLLGVQGGLRGSQTDDHLDSKPMTAVELAPLVGAHARSLHRFMRTLAGMVFLLRAKRIALLLPPWAQRSRLGLLGPRGLASLRSAAPGLQPPSTTSCIP